MTYSMTWEIVSLLDKRKSNNKIFMNKNKVKYILIKSLKEIKYYLSDYKYIGYNTGNEFSSNITSY